MANTYHVCETSSGWAVFRDDESYAEFLDRAQAVEAATLLTSGDTDETDYEWVSPT